MTAEADIDKFGGAPTASGRATKDQIKSALAEIVGEDFVLDSAVDLSVYESDAETLDMARPDFVTLPNSVEAVAKIVRLADKHKIPIVPRGAGTGLSGGATSIMGGISIVLTRMTKILAIDAKAATVRVEAGVTNLAVSQAAQAFGLYFAPDPSSQIASTIGGNIAENAGGPHTLKYGMTNNHVLAVTVVLPDGNITTLGGEHKSPLGLDLLGLFCGSEGTLGLVVEATLRLLPQPSAVATMIAYFSTLAAAGQAVSDIIACGVVPAAMEMIDQLSINAVEDFLHLGLKRDAAALLIIELDGIEAEIKVHRGIVETCLQANQAISIHMASGPQERARIWRARKSAFGALGRIAPHGYVLDGVIPRSRLVEAINEIEKIGQKYFLTIANVYHAGDGNLHPCILFHRDNASQTQCAMLAAQEILQLCVRLGGVLSGEHGIGIEKLSEMKTMFTPAELALMAEIKTCFDPAGISNPGKVIPMKNICGESGRRPLLRYNLTL